MAQSLPDLLAENQIRLKRTSAGHQEHVLCPKCEGGRTKERSLSVKVDDDGMGATWNCKRGSCGWTGGGNFRTQDYARVPQRVAVKPKPHTVEQLDNRPTWLWEFFDARQIGAKTVRHFGVYAAKRWFPAPLGEADAIVFPFVYHGEVVNRKYRPHPAKNPMMQEKDALPTLFNVDAIEGAETVYWVEGEIDVLAMHEAGYPATVTLKDGAPAQVSAHGSGKRFEAMATHVDALDKVRRFYLAGDMDAPGMALREELAQRLGRHRCWLVTWPEGCKDASDVLQHHGPEAIQKALQEAAPYPIDGLQEIKPGALLDLRSKPPPPVLHTGIKMLDDAIRFPADGRLIVVTGFPASGKTTFTRFLMMKLARRYDRKWLVFSPEMQPWLSFVAECAEVIMRKPFYGEGRMSDHEVSTAEVWLRDHVWMLENDSEEAPPSLDWVLERGAYAALAYGVTDLLIDPWNELESSRGTMSETDFIGRGLQRCKAACKRHGFNVWIIAHPAKPFMLKAGEKPSAPGPYQISGSAHWANKTDLGITVHQPDDIEGGADIHLWKARYSRWGRKGAVAKMLVDLRIGHYSGTGSNAPAFDAETGEILE